MLAIALAHVLPLHSMLFLPRFSRLLFIANLAAALVEFAAEGRAQGLTADAGVHIIGNLAAPVRFGQIEAGKRVVFAQGVRRPVHWHQDAAQVGMTLEGDAEEIVDLAFVPVRAWPHTRYRRHRWVVLTPLAYAHLQAQLALVGQRKQVIDDIVARHAL